MRWGDEAKIGKVCKCSEISWGRCFALGEVCGFGRRRLDATVFSCRVRTFGGASLDISCGDQFHKCFEHLLQWHISCIVPGRVSPSPGSSTVGWWPGSAVSSCNASSGVGTRSRAYGGLLKWQMTQIQRSSRDFRRCVGSVWICCKVVELLEQIARDRSRFAAKKKDWQLLGGWRCSDLHFPNSVWFWVWLPKTPELRHFLSLFFAAVIILCLDIWKSWEFLNYNPLPGGLQRPMPFGSPTCSFCTVHLPAGHWFQSTSALWRTSSVRFYSPFRCATRPQTVKPSLYVLWFVIVTNFHYLWSQATEMTWCSFPE